MNHVRQLSGIALSRHTPTVRQNAEKGQQKATEKSGNPWKSMQNLQLQPMIGIRYTERALVR